MAYRPMMRKIQIVLMIGGIVLFAIGNITFTSEEDPNAPLGIWGLLGIVGFFMIILGAIAGAMNAFRMAESGEYRKMSRRKDWIYLLIFSLYSLFETYRMWSAAPSEYDNSPLLMLLFLVVIIGFGMYWEKKYRNLSWSEMFATAGLLGLVGLGGFVPKDEREAYLIERASRYAFAAGTFLLLVTGIILNFASVPQTMQPLFFLIIGIVGIQLAIRGFLVWKWGIQ